MGGWVSLLQQVAMTEDGQIPLNLVENNKVDYIGRSQSVHLSGSALEIRKVRLAQ